ASTQAAIASEMVITLAERTGQDPETLWKEMGFDVAASLTVEQDETALPQGGAPGSRVAKPPTDAELSKAVEALSPQEFEAWKAGREGLGNSAIADRMNEAEPDAKFSPANVKVMLAKARAKGFDVQKSTVSRTSETQRVVDLR